VPFVLRRALTGEFIVTSKRIYVVWCGELSDAAVFPTEQDLAALLLEREAFPLLVVRGS
jgi:hypothetical protein